MHAASFILLLFVIEEQFSVSCSFGAPTFRFVSRYDTNLKSSRMPDFSSPEDQAELDKIMNGDYWDEEVAVDFSDNLPKKKGSQAQKQKDFKPSSPTPPTTPIAPTSTSAKKVVAPNADWRTAASKPAADLRQQREKKPPAPMNPADIDFMDLDYDDFEAAMREEEGGGFNPGGGGSKSTYAPEVHEGLMAGDIVPIDLWEKLLDAEGNSYKFSRVHKDVSDVVVVYADPRRMTDEFKVILSQFSKLPLATLKIAAAAINCDDVNDHRKYVKKNTFSCTLLSDPTKCFMDSVKARTSRRITASLLFLDVKSGKVLKIWYENDWDAFSTKDLIVNEIKAYRSNPKAYVQMQIGIR